MITVSNNGVGIDESDYDKIFTKFSRIDNPLTRKVQGAGLGLYITKSLIEKMNGEISVQSKELNDSPVVVNLSPSSTDWTNSVSGFVNETLKPQNVVIVHQKDMAHVESTKRLKDKFKDTVQVINSEQFDPNVMEVRPLQLSNASSLILVTL